MFTIDRKKYLILPHFKFIGNKIIFLDKYKYFVANKNSTLNYAGKIDFLLNEGVIIRKRAKKKIGKRGGHKILVIEPHPDDFALSASGFVLNKKYRDVKVLNIFSKTLAVNFPWGNKFLIDEDDFETMRIRESEIAIKQYFGLNFESLRLPLAQKRGHRNNFCTQKIKSEGALVKVLSQKFTNEIKRHNYDILLCPLGVQNHIDHIVAFEACILAYKKISKQNNKFKLIFYEEYPYARNKKSLFERLKYLNTFLKLEKTFVDVSNHLQTINNAIMIYRTQFDDINSEQMLNLIEKDFQAVFSEEITPNKNEPRLLQRYYKLEKIL